MGDCTEVLKPKDFASPQDVKWCPGCGDYAILEQIKRTLADSGVRKEDTVFISGIGCSSRFPYHVDTYGMHSIHGRAPAIASGIKALNPALNVWVVTGDGDALAIGGNHIIHALRRNIGINIILFNNQIYGLTKGQYSPTSEKGKVTKSSPHGSIDYPFNPVALGLGSGGSFVARSIDNDAQHLRPILKRANEHKGTSFVEVYQNCTTFNDGAFAAFTDKQFKQDRCLFVEHGKPLIFGANQDKGILLNGMTPKVGTIGVDCTIEDLWVHDETNFAKAQVLASFFDDPEEPNFLPRPFGIFYALEKPTYEYLLQDQVDSTTTKFGFGDLDAIIAGKNTWEVV